MCTVPHSHSPQPVQSIITKLLKQLGGGFRINLKTLDLATPNKIILPSIDKVNTMISILGQEIPKLNDPYV